ncbi:MAG: Sodium:dicarboxylate symporter family protein [Gammaproteobacteria bacterium]|jgi:Na+/H+-dicarboxylate symporter|nr:Sodium:dicarboxylate symporter family protein [Gammaproteobacteria bacterium]
MFRKMPFILGALIIASVLLDQLMPLELKQALYALSLSIKSFIVFLLPVIIFGLLFRALTTLSQSATWVIGLILACVCVSNFMSTFFSHYVGIWVYRFDHTLLLPDQTQGLQALWSWELPRLIENDKAMFLGITSGFLFSVVHKEMASQISHRLEYMVEKILGVFTYLIPAFVVGFVIKLQFDGVIVTILKDYTLIFAVVALSQFAYVLLAYFILNRASIREFLEAIKNMLPAAISGFSTMSSAAAMPLTLIGVQNNAQDKNLSKSVVPATVNIHLVGDCFAIPIFAYAVLKNYGLDEPSLINYLTFALYFVLAKFSVAAIPGGGIIVMLPILESQLGFNTEMMSLITALYILFDPVITAANVMGNGAFAKMIDRLMVFIRKPSPDLQAIDETETI